MHSIKALSAPDIPATMVGGRSLRLYPRHAAGRRLREGGAICAPIRRDAGEVARDVGRQCHVEAIGVLLRFHVAPVAIFERAFRSLGMLAIAAEPAKWDAEKDVGGLADCCAEITQHSSDRQRHIRRGLLTAICVRPSWRVSDGGRDAILERMLLGQLGSSFDSNWTHGCRRSCHG